MYHIVGGYHDSGFRALMIVFILCYTAILKHVAMSIKQCKYEYLYVME